MKHTLRILRTGSLGFAALGLTFAGCGGGGSSTGSAATAFQLENLSILNGSTWQINRPISVTFSEDVDFSTVNLNTVQVSEVGGGPAAGEFRQGTVGATSTIDPRKIVFYPRCPTLSDFSDAGLRPGGISYRLNVVGGSSLTVRSVSGEALALGQTVDFVTPNTTEATLVFVDTVSGPPSARIRPFSPAAPDYDSLDRTYIELGTGERQYFRQREVEDIDLGATTDDLDFLAPLNLYSRVEEQLAIVLVLNQPVDPSAANINSENIRLEYKEGSSWIPLSHSVQLTANCTEVGSLVRLTPTGILPQERTVRVVLSSALRDVVGDVNLVDIVVGSFVIETAPNAVGADEVLEEFTTSAREDQVTQLSDPTAPHAQWTDGALEPNFDFAGTGGPPDGQFDYWVGLPTVGSTPENPILDTTFTLITDRTQSRTEAVVNGIMDVRDFVIWANSTVTVLGPNPLKIYASRDVRIEGSLILRGSNNKGVATLNTTCLPEEGADGNAGGGRGGKGSYLTTQSTPKGEDGSGAFNLPSLGGEGGHTAYRASGDEARRPGGGGGGRLGAAVAEVQRPICFDQTFVGLDAEDGHHGTPGANDAILGSGVKPQGGKVGPRPFGDGIDLNDFYGTMVTVPGNVLVRGELSQAWAGAGGGGGGDSCQTSSFPSTPFLCSGDEKGCGAGGGGGSLTILALGSVTLAAKGKIDATGGAGCGGENSLSGGVTRIGGGSGGGSGGHIIIHSATAIDLSACIASGIYNIPSAGIFARGGQGGAGKNDQGGAKSPGSGPYNPATDALPPNCYPTTAASTTECEVVNGTFGYTITNTIGNGPTLNDGDPQNVVSGAGGDGGPGLIQLHVQRLGNTAATSDLKIPLNTTLNPVKWLISPPPVGATLSNVQTPASWNQLLPQFGPRSTGVSNWIPLGAANITVGSATPHAVQFLFGGTSTATGLVQSAGGVVTQLPALLTGTTVADPGLPYVTEDERTLVFDATGLDDIYKHNPTLLNRFGVELSGSTDAEFEVVSASYDGDLDQIRLNVGTSGTPLADFVTGASVTVIPRYFRVSTNGTEDSLPASSTIQVRFQAAPADSAGNPSLGSATAWLSDAAQIQSAPGSENFKFVRFRVDFDIQADAQPLTFSTPRPKIDFLRLPFKF